MSHIEPMGFGLRQGRRALRPSVNVPAEVTTLENRVVLHGMGMSSPAPQIAEIAGMLARVDTSMVNTINTTTKSCDINKLDALGIAVFGNQSSFLRNARTALKTLNRNIPNLEKVREASYQEAVRLLQNADTSDPQIESAINKYNTSAKRFDALISKMESIQTILVGVSLTN